MLPLATDWLAGIRLAEPSSTSKPSILSDLDDRIFCIASRLFDAAERCNPGELDDGRCLVVRSLEDTLIVVLADLKECGDEDRDACLEEDRGDVILLIEVTSFISNSPSSFPTSCRMLEVIDSSGREEDLERACRCRSNAVSKSTFDDLPFLRILMGASPWLLP